MQISIVTRQLEGSTKPGESGVAAASLALALARCGHRATLLFTGEGAIDYAHPSIRALLRAGVRLVWIEIHRQQVYPKYLRETSSAFEYLRDADDDLVLFDDRCGGAFASVIARNAGLALQATKLVVVAHGPTAWALEHGNVSAADAETLARLHMERVVFEGADHVVCASDAMADWLASQGIKPRDIVMLPRWMTVQPSFEAALEIESAERHVSRGSDAPNVMRQQGGASEFMTRWDDWLRRQAGSPGVEAARAGEESRPNPVRLTVIVTHYERPQLVNQTLDSLALQTNLRFDVVLVDDGSRSPAALDNLDKIARTSWPFPLRVIRQRNAYLGAARNAGLRHTASEFVIFMDDDNIAFPTMVDTFLTAQKFSQADIITSQMQIFREPTGLPDPALIRDGERWSFTGGPTELGLSINCFGDATGIYRRDVFDRVGRFHEWHGIGHEDWHLHARASLAGLKHVSLPIPLYWYRRVEGSMLHATDRYENNRIIWNVYREAMPAALRRCVDLAILEDG